MRYRFSSQAHFDLVDIIVSGTNRFGAKQSATYVSKLKQVVELIARFPHMARLRKDLPQAVRIHPYGKHLIVYAIENDCVVVIRLLHASSNLMDHILAD